MELGLVYAGKECGNALLAFLKTSCTGSRCMHLVGIHHLWLVLKPVVFVFEAVSVL